MIASRSEKAIVLGVTSSMSLRLITGLPERLRDAGWEVHLVASPDTGNDVPHTPGVKRHDIPMHRSPAPLADAISLIRWVKLLVKIRPRVVLAGTPKCGLLGMVAARLVRVPIRIYHLRGLRLETAEGFARRLLEWLERLTIRSATTTLAVSDSLKSATVRQVKLAESDIIVLGHGSSNGVDLTRFRPSRRSEALRRNLGITDDVPVIGFVGRLARDKGAHEMLGASRILAQRGIAHQLLIVGGIEDAATRTLLESARVGQVRVVETGPVADAAPYYSAMTLLCLPTWREGFPNVVLEAAASHVPVVTTDATGAIDAVGNGEFGYVSRVGDTEELAEKLEFVLSHPDDASEVASRAYERVHRHFGREHVQDLVIRFVETASSSGSRG